MTKAKVKKSLLDSVKALAESRRVKPTPTKAALRCMRKHSSQLSYELARLGIGEAKVCSQCALLSESRVRGRASHSRAKRKTLLSRKRRRK